MDAAVRKVLPEEVVKLLLFCRGQGEHLGAREFSPRCEINGMVPCLLQWECHGMTSLPLLHPPLATSEPFCLCSAPSTSTLLQLRSMLVQLTQLHCTHSGLTADQHQTCSDLVPTPRAIICIPFLHSSYLPDPFSLTIMGNYSSLV